MDDFARAVQGSRVILIAGTGVSAAATGNSPSATWAGLIRSGIETAHRLDPAQCDSAWKAVVEQALTIGIERGNTGLLINAASMVRSALTEIGTQAYANWLETEIGNLEVTNDDVPKALGSLPFPILTTNYDTLLDNTCARGTASWTDPKALQEVLLATTNHVGHLHGVWNNPASVILSDSDYARHGIAEAVQHLERAISSVMQVIYVGFGSGLTDPNFSKLLEWHRRVFPDSAAKHFRLCLESELPQLQVTHANDNIVPVVYGTGHDDLATFLSGLQPAAGAVQLSPAGIATDVVASAQQALATQLVGEMIICENLDNLREVTVEAAVLPPILLPVPHAEFVKSRKAAGGKRTQLERISPEIDATEAEAILLVGDDDSGLTTAVKWMAWRAAVNLGSVAPLYVNFKNCAPRVPHPLEDQVRAAGWQAGILSSKADSLPPHVLALDDFSPYVSRVSDKVIADLAASDAFVKVIGCRTGHQEDVLERLRAAGINPRTRYLGRLSTPDVRRLAQTISPFHYARLADSVIQVLKAESLPRTPFSVSLLLSIVARGGSIVSSASQTAILEQYVSLLLGRGDPHEDARIGMEQTNREALLAHLAEFFVVNSSAGLPEGTVVTHLKEVLERLGWRESPSELLSNFVQRRVLRFENGHVIFARTSYLYLFAAKRAAKSPDFLTKLTVHPLYYAGILKAYAALVRNDAELLSTLKDLVSPTGLVEDAAPFAVLDKIEVPELSPDASAAPGRDLAPADKPEEPVLDDDADDTDRPPVFPGEDPEELPPVLRLLKAVDLVSTVLRDSDQIENLELKGEVLTSTLNSWGEMIGVVSADKSFLDFVQVMVEELVQSRYQDEDERERVTADFSRMLPSAMALSGIEITLASRKLVTVFDRALQAGALGANRDIAIASAFFAYCVGEPGWPAHVKTLIDGHGDRWIVREFLLYFLFDRYLNSELSAADSDILLDECVRIYADRRRFRDPAQKKAYIADSRQDFQRQRLIRQGATSLRLSDTKDVGGGLAD